MTEKEKQGGRGSFCCNEKKKKRLVQSVWEIDSIPSKQTTTKFKTTKRHEEKGVTSGSLCGLLDRFFGCKTVRYATTGIRSFIIAYIKLMLIAADRNVGPLGLRSG